MNGHPGEVIVRGSAAGFAQEIIAGPHRMADEPAAAGGTETTESSETSSSSGR